MHISQLVHQISEQLRKSGVTTPIREARLILQHALNLPYLTIITDPTFELTPDQTLKAEEWAKRRSAREPLSKIIGKKEFWGLEFAVTVTTQTLDPRPDSETIIEAVIACHPDKHHPWKILDLGTGSGCLILSLLHEYPYAEGTAIDQSPAALQVTLSNARSLNSLSRLTCRQAHWCDGLQDTIDIIVSNPPYIPLHTPLEPEVINFDPPEALFSGPDGLDAYRAIAQNVGKVMKPNAHLFLEIGIGQDKSVEEIFTNGGLKLIEKRRDLANIVRCLIFCKKDT
jgi:release factor glutamine methyltransferase